MDTMMGKANGAHGAERMALMQQHKRWIDNSFGTLHHRR
jgi:hypothetical protein